MIFFKIPSPLTPSDAARADSLTVRASLKAAVDRDATLIAIRKTTGIFLNEMMLLQDAYFDYRLGHSGTKPFKQRYASIKRRVGGRSARKCLATIMKAVDEVIDRNRLQG